MFALQTVKSVKLVAGIEKKIQKWKLENRKLVMKDYLHLKSMWKCHVLLKWRYLFDQEYRSTLLSLLNDFPIPIEWAWELFPWEIINFFFFFNFFSISLSSDSFECCKTFASNWIGNRWYHKLNKEVSESQCCNNLHR